MKTRFKAFLILSSFLSLNALATTYCDNGTVAPSNSSSADVDLAQRDDAVIESSLFVGSYADGGASPQGKTFFDRRSSGTYQARWAWVNTTNHPAIGGTFDTLFDSASYTGSFDAQAFKMADYRTISFPNQSPGIHKIRSTFSGASNCSDEFQFTVEKTNTIGQLEPPVPVTSLTQGGQIIGAACLKGAITNRVMDGASVDIYAGQTVATLKTLGAAKAEIANPSSPLVGQCGGTSGFNLQLSERQQAEYCGDQIWAGIKDVAPSSSTYLVNSSTYLVPCALRPLADNISLGANNQTVSVTGLNFKSNTTVDLYEGSTLWKRVPISFSSRTNISFNLPDISPPSRCNVQSTCNLTIRFTNPEGAALGIYTEKVMALPSLANQNKSVVTSTQFDSSSFNWYLRLLGSGFTPNMTATLIDDLGNVWETNPGITFTSATDVKIFVPQTMPSGCNFQKSCAASVKLSVSFSYSVVDPSLKSTVETRVNFTVPKKPISVPDSYNPFSYNYTTLATASNLGSCAWSYVTYVGDSGPNVSKLSCTINGVSGILVASKTDSGGSCYLDQPSSGFFYSTSNPSCSSFILYRTVLPAPSSATASIVSNTLKVSWAAVAPTNATYYKLYRNGVLRADVYSTEFNDTTAVAGTRYSYSVKACIGYNCAADQAFTNSVTLPTNNTTDFNEPTKNGIPLGAGPTPVSGTTYFTGDSVAFILASTASAFCSTSGYLDAASYTTGTGYGAHTFAARGTYFYTANAYPFTKISSVKCFK